MTVHHESDLVTLHHGDCEDVLRGLPDGSVDAVVTDPPYGLEFMGKDWDRFRLDDPGTRRWRGDRAGAQGSLEATDGIEAVRNLPAYGGQRPRTSRCAACGKRDMMRQPHACGDDAVWISEITKPHEPPPAMLAFGEWVRQWAVEVYRVLKPGGHMVAFGGSRTWHRLAAGIEDAGFDVRDSLAWMYASGFPKSLNLVDEDGERTGQGTALKPAFEPIVLARKPLVRTVAETVAQYGTGVVNIDACRIPMSEADAAEINAKRAGMDLDSYERRPGDVLNLSTNPIPLAAATAHQFGRWPSNVLLDEHQAGVLDATSDLAARFFFVSKADHNERVTVDDIAHPTVKPLDVMRWLVRLITPEGGTVLEPFTGSGTTVEACLLEGVRCIAIEREAEYLPLIEARIQRAKRAGRLPSAQYARVLRRLAEPEDPDAGSFFDLLEEAADA